MGPSNAYFFLAIAYTLAIILIYCMGNLGVVLFYARHRRSEFNWFLHGVLPVAATIAFLWIGYTNIWPVPAYPVNWSPYLVGGWILLGIIVLVVLNRLGKEEWLLQAGKAANVVPADEPELRRASSSTSPSPSAEIPGGSASPSTG
jgi:amino acid transporter